MKNAHFSIDGLRPPEKRVLEHVQRLLQGKDLQLVGSVCGSIMLEVIMLIHQNNLDIAEIDQTIDDFMFAMKSLARSRLTEMEIGEETVQ